MRVLQSVYLSVFTPRTYVIAQDASIGQLRLTAADGEAESPSEYRAYSYRDAEGREGDEHAGMLDMMFIIMLYR